MKKTKILLLDGQNINTLAMTRELGRNGYHVGVTCMNRYGLTLFSKYASDRFLVPDYQSRQKYVKAIARIAIDNDYSVVIPIGLESYLAFSEFRNLVPDTIMVPLPSTESMDIASSKDLTFEHAHNIGLCIPKTLKVEDSRSTDLTEFIERVGFPMVVKGSICGVENLRFCNNDKELVRALSKLLRFEDRVVCQEYIEGDTHGFYTYYHQGRMYGSFMHERIKEYPITGGPSAVAKSYHDEQLENISRKLLDSLDWNGPAMVEWKKDTKDNQYKLIEINPKLWGSLDLTIQSGVNIPMLMVKTLLEEDIEPILTYRDMVFSWTFPSEALHFAATGFSRMELPEGFNSMNNICGDDLLPTVVQMGQFALKLIILLIKGKLKYPSGKPTLE